MSRWMTSLLIIILLTLLMPMVDEALSAAPAFTTDNLLRGTLVSSFAP